MPQPPSGRIDRVVIAATIAFVVVALGLLALTQLLPEGNSLVATRDMFTNPPTEKPMGVVMVWVEKGVDPKGVLVRYGADPASIHVLATDKATGEVPPTAVERTVRRLQGDPDVKDAGFLTVRNGEDWTGVPTLGRRAK